MSCAGRRLDVLERRVLAPERNVLRNRPRKEINVLKDGRDCIEELSAR